MDLRSTQCRPARREVSQNSADERERRDSSACDIDARVFDTSVFQMLLVAFTSWLDRQERHALRYLIEENRVLRRQLQGDACD